MFEQGITRDRLSRFFLLGLTREGVIQATVSELGPPCPWVRPQLGRVLTGSIGTDGVVRTSASEVKFLDRGKTDFRTSSLIKDDSVGIEAY